MGWGDSRQPRSAADEAEFRRLVDDAKQRHNISDVAKVDRKIRRVGNEFVALCAFHDERTPSMRLNDQRGLYHCFGCGACGDIVKYVVLTRGLGFMEALRWLGANLPEASPVARAQAAAEDEAERRAAIEEARAIWERAQPPQGTPAEVYVRSRGIVAALPPSIRFAMVHAWRDRETGECGPDRPALVGAVSDGDNRVIGIQRIFLRNGGTAKANMRKPKLSLGRVRGGSLRLGPVADELIMCEGPEDGLSLSQGMPGKSVWVALGTALMPEIEFPASVRSIVIAGQNDEPGRVAVKAAGVALAERGFEVRTMFPDPAYKDFNDQLMGRRIADLRKGGGQ